MAAPLTKLFVGNLPDGCTNEELQTLFERYGRVAECDVINKYGFVHMSSPEEAEKAIKGLRNSNFRGSYLSVERSKSKLHPEPGVPGRARGVMPVMRGRSGYGGDGPPHGGYRNRFNHSEGPPFGGRGNFFPNRHGGGMGRRMKPYPTPYDKPSMSPPRDDYPYRSSSYSVGVSRDPYVPSAPPRDIYNRRATAHPSTNDYLSSRRSPPLQESSANRGSSICLSDDRSSSSPEIIYQKINLGSHGEHSPMDRSRAGERRSSSCSYDDRPSSSEPSSSRKKIFRSRRERSSMDRSRAGERRSSSCSYDDRASSSEPRSSRRKIFRSRSERSPMDRSRAVERGSSSCSSDGRSSSSESSSTRKKYRGSHGEHSPMDRSLIATSKIVPERSARAREKERRSSFCSSDDRSSSSPEPSYSRKKSHQVIGTDRQSSFPWKMHRSPSPGPSRKRESYPDQVPNYHDRKHAENQEAVVQLCHPTAGTSKLKDLFSDFNVDFSKMRRRITEGGAYTGDIRLTLASRNEAKRAVRLLNGSYVDGTPIDMFIVE